MPHCCVASGRASRPSSSPIRNMIFGAAFVPSMRTRCNSQRTTTAPSCLFPTHDERAVFCEPNDVAIHFHLQRRRSKTPSPRHYMKSSCSSCTSARPLYLAQCVRELSTMGKPSLASWGNRAACTSRTCNHRNVRRSHPPPFLNQKAFIFTTRKRRGALNRSRSP